MINIQSIASEIANAVASQLASVNQNATTGRSADDIQLMVASVLRRIDLVTRDEFDAQAAVLLRTRQKLEQLEQQVDELEALQLPK